MEQAKTALTVNYKPMQKKLIAKYLGLRLRFRLYFSTQVFLKEYSERLSKRLFQCSCFVFSVYGAPFVYPNLCNVFLHI